MLYPLLKFAHIAGLMLIAAGLIGVFLADIRTRQARTLPVFAEAVRGIALFYDGLVVPGALLLMASGGGLIAAFYGWGGVAETPWLAGMLILFAFEFVEGNTVTRVYFMRLRRLTRDAMRQGGFTAELEAARGQPVATFTHFLDLPLLLVIVSLGVMRPADWTHFAVGCTTAVLLATALTLTLPRLYTTDPAAAIP